MRRWLVFITLVLTLGALTTVAIAWFAAGVEHLQIGNRVLLERRRWGSMTTVAPLWWGMTFKDPMRESWSLRRDTFERFDVPYEPPNALPSWSVRYGDHTIDTCVVEAQYGWPLRAMRSRVRYENEDTDTIYEGESLPTLGLESGIPISARVILVVADSLDERIGSWSTDMQAPYRTASLPIWPLWSGFAFNTILFVLVWSAVGLARRPLRAVRTLLRGSRGRCVQCGYPLLHGTSDRCSECGTARVQPIPLVTRGRLAVLSVAVVVLAAVLSAWALDLRVSVRGLSLAGEAAKRGDIAALRSFSNDPGAWLNPEHDEDALWWAAWNGDPEVIRSVLEYRVLPNFQWGYTDPLAIAARRGNFRAVVTLITSADSPATDGEVARALREAARSDRLDIVEFLARVHITAAAWSEAADAEVEAPDWEGNLVRDALAVVAGVENPRHLELLLALAREAYMERDASGADECLATLRHVQGMSAIRQSLKHRRRAQFEILTEGLSPLWDEESSFTLVGTAIASNGIESLELLLESGLITSLDGGAVVHCALLSESMPMFRRVLAAGADPNEIADNQTLLITAALVGSPVEVFETLLAAGADPNLVPSDRPLAHAIRWDSADDAILDLLIRHGMKIDEPDYQAGESVLHMQVREGSMRGIKRLLAAGADPEFRDTAEQSPLELARSLAIAGPTYQSWTPAEMRRIVRQLEANIAKR